MGHAVSPMGQHKFDYKNMETLAKQLANAFEANVLYGYYDTFYFDWDGFEREPSYEYVVFGQYNYPNAEKNLWLNDELYFYRIVLNKYGNNAYNLPFFRNSEFEQDELRSTRNDFYYELKDFDTRDDYCVIVNDTIQDFYNSYDSKWTGFCWSFTDIDINGWHMESTMEYRHLIQKFFSKFKCTEVYYIDDQGKAGHLTCSNIYWNQIVEELKNNFGQLTINIPEIILQKTKLPEDMFPVAFFDDFTDLK